MKVLVLIISSNTQPIYDEHKKLWLSYMNSNPQLECYFIQYRDGSQQIEGNTFWLRGNESYPGILIKTLDTLDFFLKKDKYDFIFRTNLSSVLNFNQLLKHLETLPKEKVYNGFIGKHINIPFVSGSGIIMSSDVAKLLVENRKMAESVKIIDDVDIGHTLSKCNIPLTLGKRCDDLKYYDDVYHYRCKHRSNIQLEIDIMKRIISKIYNVF
jgi:hypothetical protein